MAQRLLFTLLLSFSLVACSPKAPLHWWNSVNAKATKLIHLEAEYNVLKKEHEELQANYFKLEHEHMNLIAEKETHKEVKENLAETGSKNGRAPASINYKVPANLDLDQKYALAFEHMREKRFSEAAITFDSFLWEPEGAPMQNSSAFYAAGVSWYKLENYKKSKKCFSEALLHADGDEKAKMNHKVGLWMRVLDHKS